MLPLTESHYSRLEQGLIDVCREHGARPIFGIRRDAWDGERFRPFSTGAELDVDEFPAPGDARSTLRALLQEANVDTGVDEGSLAAMPRDATWELMGEVAARATFGTVPLIEDISNVRRIWPQLT